MSLSYLALQEQVFLILVWLFSTAGITECFLSRSAAMKQASYFWSPSQLFLCNYKEEHGSQIKHAVPNRYNNLI